MPCVKQCMPWHEMAWISVYSDDGFLEVSSRVALENKTLVCTCSRGYTPYKKTTTVGPSGVQRIPLTVLAASNLVLKACGGCSACWGAASRTKPSGAFRA